VVCLPSIVGARDLNVVELTIEPTPIAVNTPMMRKPRLLKLAFNAVIPSQNQPDELSWSPTRPSASMPPIRKATTTATKVIVRL